MPGQLPENTMTTPEYRQPTHREELERELVHGAATHIASEPHHAGAIAEAIKTVLDTLTTPRRPDGGTTSESTP